MTRTKNCYRVERYAPDGHGWPGVAYDDRPTRHATLAEARAEVRRRLGLQALRAARRWYPDDAVEAYHDRRASEPNAEGCGGIMIVAEERS